MKGSIPSPEEFTYEHLQSAYARIDALQEQLEQSQAEHREIGRFLMRWALEDETIKNNGRFDFKTGLLKDEYFREEVSKITEPSSRAQDKDRRHSLIIADLDDFKLINELIGYRRADEECLAPVGKMIKKNIRHNNDLAGRFGGEEFVIFLADTGLENAMIVADKLRNQVNEISWKDQVQDERVPDHLGISMGVSEFIQGTPYAEVFDKANEAVTDAKKLNGKNQTVIYQG